MKTETQEKAKEFTEFNEALRTMLKKNPNRLRRHEECDWVVENFIDLLPDKSRNNRKADETGETYCLRAATFFAQQTAYSDKVLRMLQHGKFGKLGITPIIRSTVKIVGGRRGWHLTVNGLHISFSFSSDVPPIRAIKADTESVIPYGSTEWVSIKAIREFWHKYMQMIIKSTENPYKSDNGVLKVN